MTDAPKVPDLPSYCAVVVVDMKDYSGHRGGEQGTLTEMIPAVLERAFREAGRPDIWEERCFPDSTGDGYAIGFRPEVLPTLIGPFLDGLQRELEYRDQVLRTVSREARMRMRVAIAVGPIMRAEGDADGTGDTRVEAHRLVDAKPLREALDRSDPDVTFVAAIISGRVYDDVVLSGYSPKVKSEYTPAGVQVKSYSGNAYLHVPKASGDLLASGQAEQVINEKTEARSTPEAKRQYSNSIHNEHKGNSSGNVIQVGRLHGGLTGNLEK